MNQRVAQYWSGKSVLITGASSGIGAAVTEALAPFGIRFGLISRREAPMRELAEKLHSSGSQFWIKSCDVRNRDDVEAAVKEFHQHAGRIDVAWINSGVGGNTSYRKWNWDLIESMLDTNLKGAIYTTHACLEVMVPAGSGTIIGIGSASSMRGMPSRGIYSATKIGLAYYLQSLAAELRQIQFTTIHPGFVDTPLNRGNPNRFWLQTPEKAAQLMIKAVAKRKRVYIYPFRMKLLYKLIHHMPESWFMRLARKMGRMSSPTGE